MSRRGWARGRWVTAPVSASCRARWAIREHRRLVIDGHRATRSANVLSSTASREERSTSQSTEIGSGSLDLHDVGHGVVAGDLELERRNSLGEVWIGVEQQYPLSGQVRSRVGEL